MTGSHGCNVSESNSCHTQAKVMVPSPPTLLVCPLEAENSEAIGRTEPLDARCENPGSLSHHMEGLLLASNTHLRLL